MTKREFDQETCINYGTHMGARSAYRHDRRGGFIGGRDLIAERAYAMARRNRFVRVGSEVHYLNRDGFLATLGRGSKYRAVATWCAWKGAPLLTVPVAKK